MTIKLKDITINVDGNIAIDYDEATKTVRVYEQYPRYTYSPYWYPWQTGQSNKLGETNPYSPYGTQITYGSNTGGQLGG